jgi:hypothetical protein
MVLVNTLICVSLSTVALAILTKEDKMCTC